MKFKRISICISGMAVSVLLLSLFVFLNGNFTEAAEFGKQNYLQRMLNDPNENPFDRLGKTIWRFNYVFNPLIFVFVSLIICVLERTKYRILSIVVALLPFAIFNFSAGSFSLRNILFAIGYFAIAIAIGIAVPLKKEVVNEELTNE